MSVFARVYTRSCFSSATRSSQTRRASNTLHIRADNKRDAKERRSEDERRPQMNFNERCVIWVFSSLSLLSLSLSLSLSSPFLSTIGTFFWAVSRALFREADRERAFVEGTALSLCIMDAL